MNRFIVTIALTVCATAAAQEIEVTSPVLKPVAITAIASDGIDAIAVWDSTLVTRITTDGRSSTPTGVRIAPRAGKSAIAYGNGQYVVAVASRAIDAIFLRRDGSVIRSIRLSDNVEGDPSVAASNAGFVLAAGRQAFVVDLAGNLIGSATLPEDAAAAASDGTRFLIAGQKNAMIVDSTGALVATHEFKTSNYYSDITAAGFDGTSYVVAWDDREHNLARHVDRDGVPIGDPLQLHDGTYTTMQAFSEDGAVVVAMTFWGSPFALSRITANGVTTATPPLGTPLVAPLGGGFIAVDTNVAFLTHDFAVDASRPKGAAVAQAAESQQLVATASNGRSVLTVWRGESYEDVYAAVTGPNGTTTPVHLDHADNIAAASNGRDFLVVYSTAWFDEVYAVAIREDGTATKPAGFWSIGFRHFVYLGVQRAGDAYLVGFVDSFVDFNGYSHDYHRLLSADGTLLGDADGGGPGLKFACATSTCLAPALGDHGVDGNLYDVHGGFLSSFAVSPQYASSPAAMNVVFDGVKYHVFWSVSPAVYSRSVTEKGGVGSVLALPSSVDASYAGNRGRVFGAWKAGPNEIGTLFIDRDDALVIGSRISTTGSVGAITATTSWLGDSLLYTRLTDDAAHGSASRIFLRPLSLAHGHAARH